MPRGPSPTAAGVRAFYFLSQDTGAVHVQDCIDGTVSFYNISETTSEFVSQLPWLPLSGPCMQLAQGCLDHANGPRLQLT